MAVTTTAAMLASYAPVFALIALVDEMRIPADGPSVMSISRMAKIFQKHQITDAQILAKDENVKHQPCGYRYT